MAKAKSIRENPNARKPKWMQTTEGRCFYCGCLTFNRGVPPDRDWLHVSPSAEMVREHMTPTIRGGTNDRCNLVPACRGCNSAKGAFTADEFRLSRGLKIGDINYRFFLEQPAPRRDWLCVHSQEFERSIMVASIPSAAEAYRLRNGWGRLGNAAWRQQ